MCYIMEGTCRLVKGVDFLKRKLILFILKAYIFLNKNINKINKL